MFEGLEEDLERVSHFIRQGGAEGYFIESAELALYLIKHSETPNLYNSIEEFATPGKGKNIRELKFPFFSIDKFYEVVTDFYTTHKPEREVTIDKVREFMEIHQYYFRQKDCELVVSDVNNLAGMIANCL